MPAPITETDSANRYHSFCDGWADGVRARSQQEAFTAHRDQGIRKAYVKGYARGVVDRQRTAKRASAMFKWTPTVLR